MRSEVSFLLTEELPDLPEIEVILDGLDVAFLMVSSCQSIVLGLTTLVSILRKRNIPESDIELQKFESDLGEYIERLELALRIQDKVREIKGLTVKPMDGSDVGYG
jgi:hypothetical protein